MQRLSLCAVSALALAATTTGQIRMTELATVNLDSTATATNPEFIGSNPTAIAWNGTDLFVAGYNNSNMGGSTALVKVSNALGSATLGTAFGTLSTPSFRGHSSIQLQGGTLVAAYDNGSSNADGIRAFDLSGNLLWSKTARGGCGVGFDPGFAGSPGGVGVAWTTFGSGRRALQDAVTGADIFTTGNGMLLLDPGNPVTTFWRDIAFNPDTGDAFLRRSNDVWIVERTGDNGSANWRPLVDATDRDFNGQQYLEYCRTAETAFIIYNDRDVTFANQSFVDTVKAVRPDGCEESIDWGSFAPMPGNAAYDFSYDAASNTLAVLDFANRNAHIFDVGVDPWYAFGSGCPGSGGIVPVLGASGSATPGSGTLSLDITDAVGGGTAWLLFGVGKGAVPLFGSCSLLAVPQIPITGGPITLTGSGAGTGTGSITVNVPSGTSGIELTTQAFVLDSGVAPPFNFAGSNGLKVIVP